MGWNQQTAKVVGSGPKVPEEATPLLADHETCDVCNKRPHPCDRFAIRVINYLLNRYFF